MNKPLAIVLGVIFGILFHFYPGFLVFIFTCAVIAFFLYKYSANDEKVFIVSIFSLGLLLRIFFVVVSVILLNRLIPAPHSLTFPGMDGLSIIGDEIGIHQRAWALANMANGMQLTEHHWKILLNFDQYGWSFQVYFLGLLYYLFGIFPVLGKCVNSLFGVLTALAIYSIAKELFGARCARLAGFMAVLFPTLFLWSITNLKDTIFIFLLISSLYFYILLLRSLSFKFFAALFICLTFFSFYRGEMTIIVISAMLIAPIFSLKWNLKKIILVVLIIFSFLTISGTQRNLTKIVEDKIKNGIIRKQEGNTASASSSYRIYPDRFYDYELYADTKNITKSELFLSFTKGVTYLMFKPLPWEINNRAQFYFLPVALLFTILFPFFIIGIIASLKNKDKRSSVLIILYVLILSILALTEGNVGTMVRHRDMLTPVYIIYSALGITQLVLNPAKAGIRKALS